MSKNASQNKNPQLYGIRPIKRRKVQPSKFLKPLKIQIKRLEKRMPLFNEPNMRMKLYKTQAA